MTFYRVIRDGVLMGVFMDIARAQAYRRHLLAERHEVYRAFRRTAEFDEAREMGRITIHDIHVADMQDALCVVTKD